MEGEVAPAVREAREALVVETEVMGAAVGAEDNVRFAAAAWSDR